MYDNLLSVTGKSTAGTKRLTAIHPPRHAGMPQIPDETTKENPMTAHRLHRFNPLLVLTLAAAALLASFHTAEAGVEIKHLMKIDPPAQILDSSASADGKADFRPDPGGSLCLFRIRREGPGPDLRRQKVCPADPARGKPADPFRQRSPHPRHPEGRPHL